MSQEETIQEIKKANISQFDWTGSVLERITDKFAKGYLTARMECHTLSLMSDSEEFREEFITCCGYDIWVK